MASSRYRIRLISRIAFWLRALVLTSIAAILMVGGVGGSASAGFADGVAGPVAYVYDGTAHSPRSSHQLRVVSDVGVRPALRQPFVHIQKSNEISRYVFAAKSVPKGIIYRRTDLLGGKPYIGQAKSESRYLTRQSEHARANPDADFEFEIIGRSNRGVELDRMEEFFIRGGGGPTNLGNPSGGLANLRHQMSDPRYRGAGGDLW